LRSTTLRTCQGCRFWFHRALSDLRGWCLHKCEFTGHADTCPLWAPD
jgi:hypothetical protein